MDTLTLLGIACIVMLPNLGVAITLWLGNKSVNVKGSNR